MSLTDHPRACDLPVWLPPLAALRHPISGQALALLLETTVERAREAAVDAIARGHLVTARVPPPQSLPLSGPAPTHYRATGLPDPGRAGAAVGEVLERHREALTRLVAGLHEHGVRAADQLEPPAQRYLLLETAPVPGHSSPQAAHVWLVHHLHDLLHAQRLAHALGLDGPVWELGAALWRTLDRLGLHEEQLAVQRLAVTAAAAAGSGYAAAAAARAAVAAAALGEGADALELAEQTRRHAVEPREIAAAHAALGHALLATPVDHPDRGARARDSFGRAIETERRRGAPEAALGALTAALARTWLTDPDPEAEARAAGLAREALALLDGPEHDLVPPAQHAEDYAAAALALADAAGAHAAHPALVRAVRLLDPVLHHRLWRRVGTLLAPTPVPTPPEQTMDQDADTVFTALGLLAPHEAPVGADALMVLLTAYGTADDGLPERLVATGVLERCVDAAGGPRYRSAPGGADREELLRRAAGLPAVPRVVRAVMQHHRAHAAGAAQVLAPGARLFADQQVLAAAPTPTAAAAAAWYGREARALLTAQQAACALAAAGPDVALCALVVELAALTHRAAYLAGEDERDERMQRAAARAAGLIGHPYLPAAWARVAGAQHRQGRDCGAAARAAVRAAGQDLWSRAAAHTARGHHHVHDGEHRQARARFGLALEADQARSAHPVVLAVRHTAIAATWLSERPHEALGQARTALALIGPEPAWVVEHAEAVLVAARALAALGHGQEAAETLRQATGRLDPEVHPRHLADLHTALGELDGRTRRQP
ncbi:MULTISPECIES: hypothetical protein [Actinosynnema]|uniref:hypothetical protein n=1 Tax=Actinosynnema TaxID=40566 RepID=UPI0020A50212|nr:hypothetical protein [Actinosynnema pretiosum]MCP2097310.1 hypothetical protein [Actinosynnema pretiosum]